MIKKVSFFLNFIKVVELINKSPVEARPTVLVSATAVGYYGLSQSYAEPPKFHTRESEHANKNPYVL